MKTREPRRKVLIKARMRMESRWGDVCIRDISSRGLLLQSSSPPARGTYLEIHRDRYIIIGKVIWECDRRFGVQTQDRLNVDLVVKNPDVSDVDRKEMSVVAPAYERRSVARDKTGAAFRSQRISSWMQCGALAIAGAWAAVMIATSVGQALAAPLELVSLQLSGSGQSHR